MSYFEIEPYSQRLTDLCDYCEVGFSLRKNIVNYFKEEYYLLQDDLNDLDSVEKASDYFKNKAIELRTNFESSTDTTFRLQTKVEYEKCNKIIQDLDDYRVILFHKNVAKSQRLAYNNDYKKVDSLRGKIMVEVDFKEKIKIGLSQRQASKEFYNQQQRSCLGCLYKISYFLYWIVFFN